MNLGDEVGTVLSAPYVQRHFADYPKTARAILSETRQTKCPGR